MNCCTSVSSVKPSGKELYSQQAQHLLTNKLQGKDRNKKENLHNNNNKLYDISRGRLNYNQIRMTKIMKNVRKSLLSKSREWLPWEAGEAGGKNEL